MSDPTVDPTNQPTQPTTQADPAAQRAQLIAALVGAKIPVAYIDPTSPLFTTLDEAATAAFSRLQPTDHEQAGIIYRNQDGTFRYSIPTDQTDHNFRLKAQLTKGMTIGSVFHTHPTDDPMSQVFSEDDINTANQLHVKSYIRFMKDGSIRSYTPGVTKMHSMPHADSPFPYKVADGDRLQSLAKAVEDSQ